MLIESENDVTPAVLDAMKNAPDARIKEIADAFVKHMHAFAKEVRLTEREWEYGIGMLNGIGKKTTDTHNEGTLFSDCIGLSTLVCLMNNGAMGTRPTQANNLGPFWREHSPPMADGASIVRSPTSASATPSGSV